MERDEKQKPLGDRTIAFVLARGQRSEAGADDVKAALSAARDARFPAVFVLADPARADDALEAVRTSGRRGRMLVQAIEYDPGSAVGLTRDAGDFELCGLPFGLLETMRVLAESVLDVYESVLVMDAAQTSIAAEHVVEICRDAREHPKACAVASWIKRTRCTPLLVTRDYLEGLGSAPYAQAFRGGEGDASSGVRPDAFADMHPAASSGGPSGVRPVARIDVFDHVFDEEEFAALAPASHVPPSVDSFLSRCTMTALEAVRMAASDARPDAAPEPAPAPAPDARPDAARTLNNADALLVQTAQRVLASSTGDSDEERAELAWADAFGERCGRDFPQLNDEEHAGRLAYLDSAATTQRVDAALRAQRSFDEHENASVYRGAYALSARATLAFDGARERLARFIGADEGEVAFTANATAAMNLVALAWGENAIGEGDVIVCELAAHHANMLPFAMLAERKGARVDYVSYGADGRIDRAAFAAALDSHPKLVCIAHVGNVFGIAAPVRELADEAHSAGARVLVDAAQSFPHEAIDVGELGADWVAVSAHKAYGPFGIGALWSSSDALAEMEPVCGGGGIVVHASTDARILKSNAKRFEPGTPPISQAIAWAAAIDYLDGIGMGNVARHTAALTRYAVRGLQRLDGVNVVGDHGHPDGWRGVVAFTVRSVSPDDLGMFLGRLGVAVRSGGHCALPLHASLGLVGTGRISIGAHTTKADIDAALTAIALCRQAFEA